MSAAKYWRDERTADAVYAVYLRKVRYVPPNSYHGVTHYRSLDPDRPDDSDHLQWETVKERVIKAGTLDRLLEALVSAEGTFDTRHFNVFFATYRAFSSTYKVLCRILARYSDVSVADGDGQEKAGPSKNAVLDSLRSVLVCWLDMYPEDFYEPPDFASLVQLIEFSRHHHLNDVKTKARKLKDRFAVTAVEGGIKSQLRSMDQHAIASAFESLDFLTSPQRVRISDVSTADVVFVAEQLTYWDSELFKQLQPNQCQGCVWSRRHKTRKEGDKVYTVRATIDQFNAVSRRAMTSIVFPDCRPEARARIIAKWIEIARELRSLKNFSSLKAVLSSLQSEPVHRLKSVWALVPSRLVQDYRDLSATFQDDDDESGARRILEEEGTAKNSPVKRFNQQRRTKSDVNLFESQGTVPYLGTFLTDLTMIDEAHPDYNEDGLINFEKRRKEFEVLAKIKLFQSAARGYLIQMDRSFCSWFQCIPGLPEKDCFTRSLIIEKQTTSTPDMRQNRKNIGANNSNGTRKTNTLSRLLMSVLGDDTPPGDTEWYSIVPPDSPTNGNASMNRSMTAPSTPGSSISWRGGHSIFYDTFHCSEFSPDRMFPQRSSSGASSKPPSDSLSQSSTTAGDSMENGAMCGSRSTTPLDGRSAAIPLPVPPPPRKSESLPNSQSSTTVGSTSMPPKASGTNFFIARVGLDDGLQTDSAGANYKCIKVENGDRMNALIGRVLEKHLIDADRSEYCLIQLLPDGGEFQLPDKCNPFYAMAPDTSGPTVNLLLRRRKADGVPAPKKLNRRKRTNLLRWSSGYL